MSYLSLILILYLVRLFFLAFLAWLLVILLEVGHNVLGNRNRGTQVLVCESVLTWPGVGLDLM